MTSFESQFLASESLKSDKKSIYEDSMFMGGLVPLVSLGKCASCQDDNKDDTILLCDGKGCSREYHLSCAGLKEIPAGDWLCVDCHITGNGYETLVDYLEMIDEARNEFDNISSEFSSYLIKKNGDKDSIELSEIREKQELAEFGTKQSHRSKRMRQVMFEGQRSPRDERELRWIGKSVLLRLPHSSTYISGRIVDHRNRHRGEHEYLVRFAAGHEERKETYHHWICLEEHCLMVGDELVWAGKGNNLAPAIVYVRTSLEILSNQLKYTTGDPNVSSSHVETTTESPSTRKGTSRSLSKTRLQRPANGIMVGYIGACIGEKFVVLDPEKDTVIPLDDPKLQGKKGMAFANEFANELAAAKAERQEEDAVRSWRALPQGNPYHRLALASRDHFSLPAFRPTTTLDDLCKDSHGSLCPLIMQGIDHMHVIKILQRQGIAPTREVASTMSIDFV